MNPKAIFLGILFGLGAVWLANNSATVNKLVRPMGAGNTPLLP